MKVIRSLDRLDKLLEQRENRQSRIEEKVRKIVKDVQLQGDNAVIFYTKKFDGVKLSPSQLRVTESEISSAFNVLSSKLISAIKQAIDNVYKFYQSQKIQPKVLRAPNGKILKTIYLPLQRVGVYIPSGTAPLTSTVYMSVIPALVAGVKEIVLVSPPTKDKFINPYILATASMLKIKEIYKIGGAQAIAALAFGTETIPSVDKIVGPGSEFVTEAKRQVFGYVDIDMLAGPSEVVILANRNANVEYIVADLEAQMEHRGGIGMVVTNSRKIKRALRKIDCDGIVVKVKNLDEAIEVVNRIAPEHLEIFTNDPFYVLKKIKCSGAIFLGEDSPVAMGDYIAGPSHVLPTGGRARFFSSLSVRDFLREVHLVRYTKKAIEEEFPALEEIASLEGMNKHIESVRKRIYKDTRAQVSNSKGVYEEVGKESSN